MLLTSSTIGIMYAPLQGLVSCYGISTIVGYFMPDFLYTYILNIYGLDWLSEPQDDHRPRSEMVRRSWCNGQARGYRHKTFLFWSIDWALSGAITLDRNEPGRDGNEKVFHIPRNFGINGASPSDCLMLYIGHSLRESHPSIEMMKKKTGQKIILPKKKSWMKKI